MRNRITVFLMLLVTLLCVLTLLIITNLSGYQKFMGELHGATLEVARGLWIALQVLFWVLLAFGAALAVLYVRDRSRVQVIAPSKRGAVQALVLADGRVEHLGGMAQMDPAAQLALLEKVMRAAGKTAAMQKRLAGQTDESGVVDADAMKRLGSGKETLPSMVRYEDIAEKIPADHALVGVDGSGVVTRQRGIKALIWVVGGSGTGKTNSVCLRVEEDYNWGHAFLVIDPHFFKEDSLYNAIKGYADRFLMPLASETEEIVQVLDTFLSEFKRRKAGGSWEVPITILIDEVGSLVSDKPESDLEKEMIAKIKQVARICGQESRGFEMTGMFISQDAAGLAWLRKRSIMVIAHQLLMMSERLLACNENAEMARAMDTWPIGRTLIYGIGFKEGQRVYQQPVFQPRVIDANPPEFYSAQTQNLSKQRANANTDSLLPANFQPVSLYSEAEASQEAGGRSDEAKSTDADLSTIKTLREIGKRLKNGETATDIVKSLGVPYGRATQEMMEAIRFVEAELNR